ncbi:MAG: hypothetical protein HY727_05410 [Candidatus Rokubacteria bacterium]|nr:hypothetical protein [Candidatus Rokubacteria bacterium]
MIVAQFGIEYEPRLVEAAVLASVTGRAEERPFLSERERLFEIADAEAREAAFRDLHARWFERLRLDRPFTVALEELPEIAARCERCLVTRGTTAGDQSADLRVAPGRPPVVLVRVLPETVAASERLLRFLRGELLHVADMLDPRFAYARSLPRAGAGGPEDRLLAERYRALWDAFVDGRLMRLGRAPASVRAENLADFARTFPGLGDRTETEFDQFFGARARTHAELLAFAEGAGASSLRCPLCGFPTRTFEPAPDLLPPAVLAAITDDFPLWSPGAGLCRRCAELYRCRPAPRG